MLTTLILMVKQTNTITFGSDCSGIGAPEVALSRIGVVFRDRFASGIDHWARRVVESGTPPPEIMSHDVTQRLPGGAPSVDLYIAGVPCVSFSAIGLKQGFDQACFFHPWERLHSVDHR